jgi:hypothetical protein
MGTYNSIVDARVAMHNDLISVIRDAFDGQCADIIQHVLNGMQFEDNFNYQDGSYIGVYSNSAWANLSNGNCDWQIFEINNIKEEN